MATPEEMTQTMINNLPEKTGKSIEQWLAITVKSDLAKHGELVKWLKTEQQITHGFANLIAHETLAARQPKSNEPTLDLVEAQYSNGKESLKPIYDCLIEKLSNFGTELEVAPKKTYVSLRHKKQFALIQPSTKTRIDVGINLKGVEPTGALEAAGSFNGMVSHRVKLNSVEDIDEKLVEHLKKAYELAG